VGLQALNFHFIFHFFWFYRDFRFFFIFYYREEWNILIELAEDEKK